MADLPAQYHLAILRNPAELTNVLRRIGTWQAACRTALLIVVHCGDHYRHIPMLGSTLGT